MTCVIAMQKVEGSSPFSRFLPVMSQRHFAPWRCWKVARSLWALLARVPQRVLIEIKGGETWTRITTVSRPRVLEPAIQPMVAGDTLDNPVTGESGVLVKTPWEGKDRSFEGKLTVQPGGAVIGEHVHHNFEERFTSRPPRHLPAVRPLAAGGRRRRIGWFRFHASGRDLILQR